MSTAFRRAQRERQREESGFYTNDPNVLQKKAREWAQVVVNLHNTPVPAPLEKDKKSLLNYAKSVKTMIESAVGSVPQLEPLNQLGALPLLVGVVGVGVAAAAITKWYIDYRKFLAKVETYNTLRQEGNSAAASAAIANEVTGEKPSAIVSVFSDTKKIAALGVAGLLGWVLLKRRGYF